MEQSREMPLVSSNVITIPSEMLRLIPLFGGDKRILNLFFRKCEYIINKYRGHEEQNIYILHAITSRLIDDAAALLSEREDITTWPDLKELLEQHFGDPRSEECIKISLESCKMKSGESYLEFCNKIQNIRSLLISKVNLALDEEVKRAKIAIYNHTALNVFLYNLPESMVRIVRLKSPSTLEQALSIVLEEVNFHDQYQVRNRIYNNITAPKPTFNVPQVIQNSHIPQQKFNFGIPNVKPQFAQQPNFNLKFTPQQSVVKSQPFANRPPPFYENPQFGYRPTFNQNPQFGYRPTFNQNPQFGYRPIFNQNPQFGYRPSQNIRMTPQQFGQKTPQNSPVESTDVSMRTAPPRRQITPGLRLNETDLQNEEIQYDNDNYDYNPYYDYANCEPDIEHEPYSPIDDSDDTNLPSSNKNDENKSFTKTQTIELNCYPNLKLPHIYIPELDAKLMIDTGSTRSFINPRLAQKHFHDFTKHEPFVVTSTHASSQHDQVAEIPLLLIFNTHGYHKFHLYDVGKNYDGLIGNDLLKQLDAVIDLKHLLLKTKTINIPIVDNDSNYTIHFRKEVDNDEILKQNFNDLHLNLLQITVSVTHSDTENESWTVNFDDKNKKQKTLSDSSIMSISNGNSTIKPISISDFETLSDPSSAKICEYPVSSPSVKTESGTVHSATILKSVKPILHEGIDAKPKENVVITWFKKETQVCDFSRKIRQSVKENKGSEDQIDIPVGKIVISKDVNKRKSKIKNKARFHKAKVKETVSRSVIPIKVGKVPIKNVKRPPQ